MEKVKKLVAAGARFASAVKDVLARDHGLTLTDVANRHEGVVREDLSAMIHQRIVPRPPYLAALAAELGGMPDEWLALWWAVAKPKPEKKKVAAGR